jgi:hypothetical protein
MDYLIEARKFIQRARHADLPEVTQTSPALSTGAGIGRSARL